MSEHETITDIIADVRKQVKLEHKSVDRLRKRGDDVDYGIGCSIEEDANYLEHIADRLEAAWKREKATTKKSLAVGDGAKLREALQQAKVAILAARKKIGVDNPIILEIIDAALAAPPRNCDVGTAEEQLKRFKDFCRIISKDETCDGCPLLPQCSTLEHCTLKWSQMPYEEGGVEHDRRGVH